MNSHIHAWLNRHHLKKQVPECICVRVEHLWLEQQSPKTNDVAQGMDRAQSFVCGGYDYKLVELLSRPVCFNTLGRGKKGTYVHIQDFYRL